MIDGMGDNRFGDRFEGDGFFPGNRVVIRNGPFEGFEGTVIEVDRLLLVANVAIAIFGCDTPLSVGFSDLEETE